MKSIVFRELPVHDTCWAITTGVDGCIYAGVCGELTGGLSVFIVRYDPDRDEVEYLLEVSPALGEPVDSGRVPHSKLHYGLIPGSDGKLYCSTHCSGPPWGHRIWRPWNTWDDPERMFVGLPIFTFEPKTEELVNFGIMSPNEGTRAMALAENRGLLYGLTWPRDHFYVYDLKKHEYKDKGRIGDENAQTLWVDTKGNGYTVDDLGYIVKYIADEDRLVHLSVRVPKDPHSPSEERSSCDTTPSPDGKSIYGTVWNLERIPFCERLFRYDLYEGDEGKIYDLGPGYGKDKLNHICGLIFGDDGYLYYAASKEDKNRRIPYRMYLFRMDVNTLKKEEICPFDDGEYHSEYIDKATKDFYGRLYFADTNNRPVRIYVYTPDYFTGKKTKRNWPFIRSWG